MKSLEKKRMATEFNKWRDKMVEDGIIYPSYSIENFVYWLERYGQKWIPKIKAKRKGNGMILGYRMKRQEGK